MISVNGTASIAADGSTAAPKDVYGQIYRYLEIIVFKAILTYGEKNGIYYETQTIIAT